MKTLKELIKESTAKFTYAIAGSLYYTLFTSDGDEYQFTIDMNDKDDVGTTTFVAEYKGITLMRYIRKALSSGMLIKTNRESNKIETINLTTEQLEQALTEAWEKGKEYGDTWAKFWNTDSVRRTEAESLKGQYEIINDIINDLK